MSPRPAASRHDAAALHFLATAAQLLDAYLDVKQEDRPPRLRAIRFPAALDWLRVEDVIRLAAENGKPNTSAKAFRQRWPTKERFLADALVYALLYEDETMVNPGNPLPLLSPLHGAPSSMAETVSQVSDATLDELACHPRSYLITHLAALLPQHPEMWNAVLPTIQTNLQRWADSYAELIEGLGIVLRPGWNPLRIQLALQAMLDGFLIRYRLQPGDYPTSRWEGAGIYADTVVAFLLGIVDSERTGKSARTALDEALGAK
ncbi:hypothetical protein [Pseudofrankia sp. DC12]|uniref:hypothetical protein n=1 Tax=Pseudofrankia sp. DC12 TaxID=683315 RepID=UPI000A5642D7|nr:hypothetical protein [Pseudofrankia sp. DC12]